MIPACSSDLDVPTYVTPVFDIDTYYGTVWSQQLSGSNLNAPISEGGSISSKGTLRFFYR